jgi:hypothetical protein
MSEAEIKFALAARLERNRLLRKLARSSDARARNILEKLADEDDNTAQSDAEKLERALKVSERS